MKKLNSNHDKNERCPEELIYMQNYDKSATKTEFLKCVSMFSLNDQSKITQNKSRENWFIRTWGQTEILESDGMK